MHIEILQNRTQAGLLLSEKLKNYQNSNSVVLAIPRGGVPVGYEIAKKLHLPLDIILSKKIGHPLNKEFAIGAISMDSTIIDEHSDVPLEYIEKEIPRLRKLLQQKYELYMGSRAPITVEGKNVIIVDDGIATGNTLLASIAMLRKSNPAKIIVAVPVLPDDAIIKIQRKADELVYLIAPTYFRGVGGFYEDFSQVEDKEAIQMLSDANPIE